MIVWGRYSMKNPIRLAVILAVFLGLGACNSDGDRASQDFNAAGHDISNSANAVGQGISNGANATGQAITTTAHNIGNSFSN
jgi:hypothetical protein